jgi:hypothetical protein
MMFQSRDEVRQTYLSVWQKMQSRSVLEPMESVIADVIRLHPEYQQLLDQKDQAMAREYTPEGGQTNPFLHMGMHIALREQTATDRPAGIQDVYNKLSSSLGVHDAEHAMMECLGQALWQAQRDNSVPDEGEYLECLKKL